MNNSKLNDNNPVIFFIILFIKVLCFYYVLTMFSHKTLYIEHIESISTFIRTVFFSKVTLSVLAITIATCLISIITLIPSFLICYILEKLIKKEITNEFCFYIAVIISCLLYTYLPGLITHIELFLCYLFFLPIEKIRIKGFIIRNKAVFIIWGIAVLMIGFVVLTFKHLDEALSNKEYTNKFKVIKNKENIYTDTSKKHVSAKVYICPGNSATVYHKYKDCKGLNRCRSKLKAVTIDEAERMGRRKCRICY